MKKFFSLICAMAIAFSASAAPVAQKAQLARKAPVAVEQTQKVQPEAQFKQVSASNTNQLSAAPALKVTNPKAQAPVKASKKVVKADHNATLAVKPAAPAKAPKAYSSTYNYKCGPTEVVVTDLSTPTYNEFKLAITQKAKNTAEYNKSTLYDNTVEIILDPDEHSIVGTFTTDDYTMSPNTYLKSGSNTRYVSAFEPSTITIESKGGNKYAITDGLLQVENGSGSYLYKYDYCYDVADLNDQTAEKTAFEFTFGENPQPAQDSIVTAVDWAYDDYWYDVYVYAENTTYVFELSQSTGGLTYGTTYTLSDMYADWVCTLDAEGQPLVKATDATLTVTKDQDGLIHIAATMVLDGVKHVISYDEAPFVPSGVQINVNGTNLAGQYMSAYGFYCYTAKWGDYTIQLPFNTTEEKETYTNDDFVANYGLIYSDDEDIYLAKLASDITVTTTETTKTLAGSVYAKNGDEYILNLVWEKPTAEEITAIVEDATLTKKTLFFMVDGNDTEHQYGITVKVNSKVFEGEFTLTDCDTWNTGVTDLTAKKWFNTDSCYISTKVLGSNTLLMEGILYTHNTSLGRLINAQFSLTARIDANGELMNSYGGIVSPAKGDTLSFTRSNKGTAFFVSSTGHLNYDNQSGKTTMIAVNDSAYYWYNPVSKYPANYWIKGIKDKQTNAIVFDTAQVIYVYDGGISSKMKWSKATAGGQISPDFEYSDVFALDIKGAENDSLVLRGSAPFDFTQEIHFPGIYIDGMGFQGYGDAGTILTLNKPITERDTVYVTSNMSISAEPAKGIIKVSAELNDTTYILELVGADTVGTFSLADGTLSQQYYYGIVSAAGRSDFAKGEVTIAKDGEDYTLTGLMIGEDEKAYVLDWTYTPVTERDTVRFNGKLVSISECISLQTGVQTGWFYELADGSTGYEFLLQSTVVDNKVGTFSYADGTLGNNYYNVYDPQGGRQQFVDGSITVAEVGDSLFLDGVLVAEDEKAYVLHFSRLASVLEYDTDAPFEATFDLDNALVQPDAQTGTTIVNVLNEDDAKAVILQFFAIAEGNKLPAGTYPINSSEEANTVLASQGVVDLQYSYSFACTVDAQGNVNETWFIVDGTVVVDENGAITVNGVNSYDKAVNITFTVSDPTALPTVKAEDAVSKFIRNGQVIIRKGNKQFNVLGAEL